MRERILGSQQVIRSGQAEAGDQALCLILSHWIRGLILNLSKERTILKKACDPRNQSWT